jgi:AcrR family transcriptional regulator
MVGKSKETPIQSRILKAAAQEFARHGLGGARVSRIARAARANKERLYHYFGNKEELFAAVLDDAMRQIAEAEPFAADDLGAYVSAMVEFHRAHPTLVRLLLAEAQDRPGRPVRLQRQRVAHYDSRAAAVRAAQQRGTIRNDLDPRLVVYLVLALVVTAEALPQFTRLILTAAPGTSLQQLLDTLLVPVSHSMPARAARPAR